MHKQYVLFRFVRETIENKKYCGKLIMNDLIRISLALFAVYILYTMYNQQQLFGFESFDNVGQAEAPPVMGRVLDVAQPDIVPAVDPIAAQFALDNPLPDGMHKNSNFIVSQNIVGVLREPNRNMSSDIRSSPIVPNNLQTGPFNQSTFHQHPFGLSGNEVRQN